MASHQRQGQRERRRDGGDFKASFFLTVESTMLCPHGGTVTGSTSNTRVKAAGAFVLRSTDTFTIGGCPHTIANVPHPCVSVRWDVHAEWHTTVRDPSLNEESIGLCLDANGGKQGMVVIASTQSRGKGI